MADGRFQEVIEILIKQIGTEEARTVAKALEGVGDAAADAEPKTQALLDELASTARLESAAEKFRTLGAAVVDTQAKIVTARGKVSALSEEIAKAEKPTEAQANAFAHAADALEKLGIRQAKQRATLSGLRVELEAGGLATTKLADAERLLSERSAASVEKLKQLAESLKAQKAAAEEAARTEQLLVDSAQQVAASLTSEAAAAAKSAAGIKALGNDFAELGAEAAKAGPRAAEFAKQIASLQEVSRAVASIGALKAQLNDVGGRLDAARKSVAALDAQFAVSGRNNEKIAGSLKTAKAAVSELEKQEKSLELSLLKANGALEKNGLSAKSLGAAQQALSDRTQQTTQSIKEYIAAMNAAGQGVGKVKKQTEESAGAFGKLRASVNSAVSSLLRVTGIAGAVSSALGAIGVGKLFGGAIDSATEFESKLSQIRAVSGASADQLRRMKQAAEDSTKSTTFSASEAADALGELVRASGDADAAIAQLAPTLNLAQAAGIGTSDAARILTTTLTQFGLAATDAGRVADLFAKEANSTQDTVLDLGNAMSYTAPLAKQLGMSLEDTTAILGALANAGFKNERAGTAFRFALTQLLDPASKFSAELRGLGINSNNFVDVVEQLAKAGDKGNAALLALGGEAGPAIRALVNGGVKDIERLKEEFRAVAGESGTTAQIMGDNFDGASKRLRNAFDQLRRDLVDPILEPLAAQFEDVSKRIRAFVETTDFATIKAAVKDFALSATEALIKLGQSVDYTALAAKIREFVTDAQGFFTSLKENATSVTSVFTATFYAVSTVFNSLQAVVLSAGTIIAGGLTLIARSALDTVKALSLLPGAGDALKGTVETLEGIVGGLTAVTADFASRAGKNFNETGEAAAKFGKAVADAATTVESSAAPVAKLGDAAKTVADGLQQAGNELKLFPDYAGGAADAVTKIVGPVQDLGRDALLTAGHITRFSDEAQKLGGGPLATAEAAVRKADVALAGLVRSGNATPDALQAAAKAAREAQADLDRLRAGAAGAADGADKLKGSFTDLGIQSQRALREAADKARIAFESIKASAAGTKEGLIDARAAFIAYAEKAIASVAASDAAAQAQVRSALIAQAAQLGVTAELEKLLATQNQVGPSADEAGRRMQAAGQAGADGFNRARDAAAGANGEIDKTKQKAAEAAQNATVSLTGVAGAVGGVGAAFAATSDAAAKFFAELVQLEGRNLSALNFGNAWDAAASRVNRATAAVQDGIDRQRESLKLAIGVVDEFGTAGEGAMLKVGGNADRAAERLDATILALKQGNSEFTLLGEQELAPLLQALESARSRVQAISEEARTAKSDLTGMVADLQNQLDQINGNQEAIENRRAQQVLEQLRERAKLAGELGAADAAQAEKLAEQVHQANLKRIRDEAAARSGGGKGGSNPPPANPRPTGGSGGSGQASGGGGSGGITYNVNLNGTFVGPKDQYVRELMAEIRRIQQRGG